MGIKIVRQALNVGDYMLAGPASEIPVVDGKPMIVSVDSKMGIGEIASCCYQEHERFRDECIRAKDLGIQLVILIEEMPPGGLLENWRSPMGKDGRPRYLFDPAHLKKVMETMTRKYNVKFRFCDGRSTGKELIEYLKGVKK